MTLFEDEHVEVSPSLQKDFSRTTLHVLQDTYYCPWEFDWVTWIVPLPLASREQQGCGSIPSPFAPDQLSPRNQKGWCPQLHLTSPLSSGCMSTADRTGGRCPTARCAAIRQRVPIRQLYLSYPKWFRFTTTAFCKWKLGSSSSCSSNLWCIFFIKSLIPSWELSVNLIWANHFLAKGEKQIKGLF